MLYVQLDTNWPDNHKIVRAGLAGGADTLDNLRVLCKPCNSRKGAKV